ncbi:MAG: type II toxin-antitoxin system PemK/MazF family toxin [Nitriliruptorales bacterium]
MRGLLYHLDTSGSLLLLEVQADVLVETPTVIGVLATADPQPVGPPLAIPLPATHTGLPHDLWAKTTQIHTVARNRLGPPAAQLPQHLLHQVATALTQVLGLPPQRNP